MTALAIARLLRSGDGAEVLQSLSAGRALLGCCGDEPGVREWLDRAVSSLRPSGERKVDEARRWRRWTIVYRYDRRREARERICRDLRISERLFYKERSAGLNRIAGMIETVQLLRLEVSERPAFETELLRIDELLHAEQLDAAVNALRVLQPGADSATRQLGVMSRAIVALANPGRLAESKHVAAEARHALPSVPLDDRTNAIGGFLRAELCRTHQQGDARGYGRTFDLLERELAAPAAEGDPCALRLLAAASIDRAFTRVDVGDSDGAQTALERARNFASRTLRPILEFEVQAAVVDVGIRVDRPQYFAGAAAQAWQTFKIAEARGFHALATRALYQCVTSALIARKPVRAARFARLLLDRSARTGNLECRSRAMLAAIGVEYVSGRHERALDRLDAFAAGAMPVVIDDVFVALLRARILAGLHRFAEGIAILDRTGKCAANANMRQAAGLAALWKSRMAVCIADLSQARIESHTSVELLTQHPTPFQLYQAFNHAFEVTAQRRYRYNASDLWQMIAPAFDETDDDHGEFTDALPSISNVVADEWTVLTLRERSVAKLVRSGRTNRQIAAQLGIGVRTVNQHVASIMRRLNVFRRWEIG
ncbi:MAG TPA: LuxR C-terminal-related transcriptional regulator [Candidatus Tumulicola sp.]